MTRQPRSRSYQHIFVERLMHESELTYPPPDPYDENETYIRDKRNYLIPIILARIQELMKSSLTTKQYTITYMYFFEHMTQQEIADKLHLSQSTVIKTIYGNMVYTHSGKHQYGGAIKRLQTVVAIDSELQLMICNLNDPEYILPDSE